MDFSQIVYLIIGLAMGCLLAWLALKVKGQSSALQANAQADEIQNTLTQLKSENSKLEERTSSQLNNIQKLETKNEALEKKSAELSQNLTATQSEKKHLEEKLNKQLQEMENLQEKFTKDFKLIAGEILERNSQKFTAQNKEHLGQILTPLGEKIKEFQKEVGEKYLHETKERSSLKTELENLMKINSQMSLEAHNLTKALKGDSKTQGNWGEFILQRLLEESGLEDGREFSVQKGYKGEEGERLHPDVIINLPDQRNMIIDSKVSLTAYERYCASETEEEKSIALKEHIQSVKTHVKELSDKKYQNIYNISSPDYVLMFMPIEPAFILAFQNDQKIYAEAYNQNIIIVCPSTLLATLGTVNYTWKQDKQKRYALEIASESGKLYDKFVAFLTDMESIGRSLDTTKSNYEKAFNKLKTGTGNLISRTEKIRGLGAKATKAIPENLVQIAAESDTSVDEHHSSTPHNLLK